VRGRNFLHPKLGIQFAVPECFVIDNAAAAVTATGPGDIAVRFDGVELNPGVSLADYVRSGWVAGLDAASIRSTSINGNEAVTARATADAWQFDVTVIRAGGNVYRLLTAAPRNSSGLEQIARQVAGSFREMSAAERASLNPLRIRILTVQPTDTVASLAARMRAQETFRLINGLASSANLSAGTKVKIITDQ
jgi:predicted Zn-dependent protease